MSKRYWSGSHTKHCIRIHLVWIPKYRHRVLRGKIVTRLRDLFYQACEVNQWWIHEMNIMEDHVHLYIQINPSESIARVVQLLKGGTSRRVREKFPELEEFLWGDSFWATGYFAESVGKVSEAVVQKYIREQRSSMPQPA